MTTSIADANIEVSTLGDGPPLLFIHGAGGSPESNFPFLARFAERHTVIAPCLPGSGASSLGDGPLEAKAVADRVGRWLDGAGVDECTVIGYSMGSAIAVELAAARRTQINAIVLTAGFVKPRPSLLNFLDVWDRLQQGPEPVLGRAILSAVMRPETLDSRGEEWVEEASGEVVRGMATGTREHLALIRGLDARESLATTVQPLLVLTPRYDRLVDPAHSDDIVEIRPDAVQVLLDAGHAVGEEDQHSWYAALTWFLRTQA